MKIKIQILWRQKAEQSISTKVSDKNQNKNQQSPHVCWWKWKLHSKSATNETLGGKNDKTFKVCLWFY